MIREFEENDLTAITQIWLDTNIKTHCFIPKEYWTDNHEMVRSVLPQAEVYVHEDDATKRIDGFIGLSDGHIEGIFVREDVQSNGIGKQLLEYAKCVKSNLSLRVYQKNTRAIQFYQREQFVIQFENTDDNTNQKEYVMTWKK
ncbi:GNAT family N-acetyltransferase [Clostridiales bacterium]|nr:GNAT family N-acetyltransferase [Clostridiales bacterium]